LITFVLVCITLILFWFIIVILHTSIIFTMLIWLPMLN
jgi:hypothetical protein